MDEFELIRRYFRRAPVDPGVLIGVGDDGAVIRPTAGTDLVMVVDTLVDGVHFPSDLDPADIGYRAVAVNLSDIAAMGGTPRWMTLALTLVEADPAWLEAFAEGLFAAADGCGVSLIGGDTTRGVATVVTVQLTGELAAGRALTRSGARPGDNVFVTGTVGDAAAGLALLRQGRLLSDDEKALVVRFSRPEPRLAAGRALLQVATAAIDVSDGLLGDCEKLAAASGVAAVIDADLLPLSAPLRAADVDAEALALTGGDDYEICFTAGDGLPPDATSIAGTPIRRIGRIESGSGVSLCRQGRPLDFRNDGYRHFG